jgi:hypothetical protein
MRKQRLLRVRATITPLSPCERGAGGEGASPPEAEAIIERPLRLHRLLAIQCVLGLLVALAVVAAMVLAGEAAPGSAKATDKPTEKPAGQAADKAAEKAPELKVLDRLIGNWHAECAEKQGDKRSRVYASITSEWILDGHFVQCKGMRTPGGTESIQIIGFDPLRKEYRMWYFDSFGTSTGPVSGQWDEAAKTLTWQGSPQDIVMLVNKERFVDANTIQWDAVGTSRTGVVLFEQRGTSIRRK